MIAAQTAALQLEIRRMEWNTSASACRAKIRAEGWRNGRMSLEQQRSIHASGSWTKTEKPLAINSESMRCLWTLRWH